MSVYYTLLAFVSPPLIDFEQTNLSSSPCSGDADFIVSVDIEAGACCPARAIARRVASRRSPRREVVVISGHEIARALAVVLGNGRDRRQRHDSTRGQEAHGERDCALEKSHSEETIDRSKECEEELNERRDGLLADRWRDGEKEKSERNDGDESEAFIDSL